MNIVARYHCSYHGYMDRKGSFYILRKHLNNINVMHYCEAEAKLLVICSHCGCQDRIEYKKLMLDHEKVCLHNPDNAEV